MVTTQYKPNNKQQRCHNNGWYADSLFPCVDVYLAESPVSGLRRTDRFLGHFGNILWKPMVSRSTECVWNQVWTDLNLSDVFIEPHINTVTVTGHPFPKHRTLAWILDKLLFTQQGHNTYSQEKQTKKYTLLVSEAWITRCLNLGWQHNRFYVFICFSKPTFSNQVWKEN